MNASYSENRLVSVAEMQAIERQADAAGLTYTQMMENAGLNLAQAVHRHYAVERAGAMILGLVGTGNNGGDTLVALAHLAAWGWPASAYLVRPRPLDDPWVQRLMQNGIPVLSQAEDPNFEQLHQKIASSAIVLDGVLGTGARLPLKPELAVSLVAARQAIDTAPLRPQVVAVDCPSGIDCDSGQAAPETIPADLTVSMAAYKTGLLRFPAYERVGNLERVGIGLESLPQILPAWQTAATRVVDAAWVRQILPVRPLEAHKGSFGTALVIAGSSNYTGAALLAGEAAYRSGAGLVTIGLPACLHTALAGHLPEATWLLLPHEMGVIAAGASEIVRANLERVTALLFGPGFGLENTTGEFIARLLEGGHSRAERARMGFAAHIASLSREEPRLPPVVVDADGLKLLARLPEWAQRLPPGSILTPHPGEMAILSGLSRDEIQAERLETARRFSQAWGHVVVLKGAFTVIAAPDGRTAIIAVATPALARAGTGDVLAGLTVGLCAQGLAPFEAALAAAWLHAQAGLQAADTLGSSAAVLAGDVLRACSVVLKKLKNGCA